MIETGEPGHHGNGGRMTIKALYKLWLEERRGGLRPASLSTYTLLAERYILPLVGEQETVSAADTERIVDEMVATGKSARTRRQALNILSNILRYGGLPAISAAGDDTPASVRILPDEAVQKLMASLRENPHPRNVGLYVALTTGLRASELCALRWQDVDDALHIRGSISYLWDTETHTWRPKEEGEQALVPRDIPLTGTQRQFLNARRGASATYLLSAELAPMQPRTLRLAARRFLAQNGLSEYSLADFRHTFAARCLRSGCNYSTLGALLGVQSVQALQKKYGRFARTDLPSAMENQMAVL